MRISAEQNLDLPAPNIELFGALTLCTLCKYMHNVYVIWYLTLNSHGIRASRTIIGLISLFVESPLIVMV